MTTSALSLFKKSHGVVTHRKGGAGHRYAWIAFFATITMKDGTRRGFKDVAAEYSMAALIGRNKVVDGADELGACKLLAELNGIPWPDDEPKKRNAKHDHTHR